ncbi:MAG: right-handed parallel beta-helix repeat-containing protein, partial [Planctomycetota bacterium]
DPLLAADGYHLEAASPCINAGDAARDYSGQTDIDGEVRVLGGRVDMGCDEFTPPPIPVIDIWPKEIEFHAKEGGANPEAQLLGIRNSGVGTLRWEISEDCPWLGATPSSGESTGEEDAATLSVDVSGLAEGMHWCELTISDPAAFNNPETVEVIVYVKGPTIELSADVFEFTAPEAGENPADQVLTIRNSGGLVLDWEISYDCNWLTIDPVSGSSTGQANEVTLSADIAGLFPSHRNCVLVISSAQASNSPQSVEVILHVEGEFRVPQDYPTIQSAVDATLDGDEVVVAAGTYTGQGNRDIEFRGKAITVRSSNPDDPNVVAATVIDCEGSAVERHRGFRFNNGEGRDSVVSGLTITNGYAPLEDHYGGLSSVGGAIWCRSCGPTISKCRLINNQAGIGGGVYGRESGPAISGCVITGNSDIGLYLRTGRTEVTDCVITDNSGRGIYIIGCWEPVISHCVITGNSGGIYSWANHDSITIDDCVICDNSSGYGGGILFRRDYTNPVVTNCTIVGNSANTYGGGIYNYDGPRVTLRNCIVWGNIGRWGAQLRGWISASYSDVQGGYGGTGNIDADPLFFNAADTDYHLVPGSPCIDVANNLAPGLGETDVEGNPRIIDGDQDGNSVVDMGAYELFPAIEVQMKLTPGVLNPGSHGKWFKAHFVLPEGYVVEDVDADRQAVLHPGAVKSEYLNVFVNEDGLVATEAAFARSGLCDISAG